MIFRNMKVLQKVHGKMELEDSFFFFFGATYPLIP